MTDSPFEPRYASKPFLMDRLVDPFATGELTRAGANGRRIFDEHDYFSSVMLNLSWLFNTTVPNDVLDTRFSQVPSSVVAFGIPELSSLSSKQIIDGTLARNIKLAVDRFEPRLRAQTVIVTIGPNERNSSSVSVVVRGTLWMLPQSQPIAIRSDYIQPQARWMVRDE